MSLYRLELGVLARDRRVRLIVAILAAVIATSFALAWGQARGFDRDAGSIAATERERWLGQDPTNPHSAAHYGQWVFKRPSPLAVLDPGVDPYVGRMVRIEAHRHRDAVFRAAQDQTPLGRGGGHSVADILHILVPLAAILLGFSAFAADRERGTLRLALGNGVSPTRLMGARFAALTTVLAAAVALPLLASGTVAIATLDGTGWQAAPRLVLWVAVELAYGALFLAFALMVSLRARTARGALALSLLVWALVCIAAPRLVTLAVEAAAPTPSHAGTLARIDRGVRDYNSAEGAAARQAALEAKPGSDRINMRGALLHVREQHDYGVLDRELGAFNAALDRQDRLFGWGGLLSPMVAAQAVSEAVAGSDYRSHIAFTDAAERFRRHLSDSMNLDLVAHPDRDGVAYKADRTVWERIPPFDPAPPSLGTSLRFAAVPAALLGGWLLLFCAIAFTLARGMRP